MDRRASGYADRGTDRGTRDTFTGGWQLVPPQRLGASDRLHDAGEEGRLARQQHVAGQTAELTRLAEEERLRTGGALSVLLLRGRLTQPL